MCLGNTFHSLTGIYQRVEDEIQDNSVRHEYIWILKIIRILFFSLLYHHDTNQLILKQTTVYY